MIVIYDLFYGRRCLGLAHAGLFVVMQAGSREDGSAETAAEADGSQQA